jgi:NodT family efflux transporter outer membrane factor (OMF) lipoprotein
LAQWWSRFDDPLLARLITQALQFNTSVTGAQAALRQARALRDVAAAGLVPTLSGSGSAQRSTAGSGATRTSANTFQAGLDANWELDIFGANRSALNAAEAVARASAASLGDVRVSIAAEVALAYIALRGTQLRLAIARDNLASQQETLQITLWRQQAGLVTAVEAEQARAVTEQTSALVPAFQTTIDQSRHALAILTGQPPAALSVALATDGAVPQAADDLALTIPAETLRKRPDVRAAEQQVTAAVARVARVDAAQWPSFNIGGSLGLKSATLGSLAERASLVGSLLAGLSMPLFDGGAARAQVQAQQAALDQARSSYQATVFTALTDVEDALVALRGERERLMHLQRAAESAGDAALLARQRYASGLIDFQTVLETQRTQLGAQDSLAAARADLGADHVRLYKALGGGWDPDADTATSLPREDTPRPEPT